MKISVVVNTACLGAKAQSVISSGGIKHGERLALLRDVLLPRLINDPLVDEVIVAGEYEAGEGYTYVPAPSVAFDCTDALHQRQAGFEASTGDVIVFLHDDHLPTEGFFEDLTGVASRTRWDVIQPARVCRRDDGLVELNNGFAEGYVMGHAVVMRRSAVIAAPWDSVAKVFTWDVSHTELLRASGQRIVVGLCVEDLEARLGATPWR